jgi:hypothetical protein
MILSTSSGLTHLTDSADIVLSKRFEARSACIVAMARLNEPVMASENLEICMCHLPWEQQDAPRTLELTTGL